jgi:hypothetical protein
MRTRNVAEFPKNIERLSDSLWEHTDQKTIQMIIPIRAQLPVSSHGLENNSRQSKKTGRELPDLLELMAFGKLGYRWQWSCHGPAIQASSTVLDTESPVGFTLFTSLGRARLRGAVPYIEKEKEKATLISERGL